MQVPERRPLEHPHIDRASQGVQPRERPQDVKAVEIRLKPDDGPRPVLKGYRFATFTQPHGLPGEDH